MSRYSASDLTYVIAPIAAHHRLGIADPVPVADHLFHVSRRRVDMTLTAETAIHRRVARLQLGSEPTCIARLPSGWAVLGEQQFLRGYSLLLPDPVVGDLNSLGAAARAQVLLDAANLGDAILAVTGARRINYAIFGNLEPALHVHVVPRYANEPAALATAHPWSYDWEQAPQFDPRRDGALLDDLRRALQSTYSRL
jgi:diadenosine tetraphosphate (Ap4A) HIT family hydrolase